MLVTRKLWLPTGAMMPAAGARGWITRQASGTGRRPARRPCRVLRLRILAVTNAM